MAKLLHRSRRHRVFGGVAGGIADYFNIDPVIVRVIFIISSFWGVGILAYIVLWIIVPDETFEYVQKEAETEAPINETPDCARSVSGGRIFLAIVLILLGLFMIVDNFVYWMDFEFFWAIILIALGLYIVFKDKIHKFQRGEE